MYRHVSEKKKKKKKNDSDNIKKILQPRIITEM